MAPEASDKSGCATMRFGSKKDWWPRPSQEGQAPIGLLKEKRRGSNSCKEYEQTGQANLLEKIISLPVSISTIMALPSAKRRAVSKDSAKRCWISGRTLMRSTTTSIECLSFFLSAGNWSTSKISAFATFAVPPPERTRKRTKPCACRSWKRSTNSPLRSLTTGAKIINFVSSGIESTVSTIWETLCASKGRSWSGQWGVPARANNKRK